MEKVVIVAAKRTPIGKFMGKLKDFSAVDLGIMAASAAVSKSEIPPEIFQNYTIGNVYGSGLGQNVARQIALGNKAPISSTAATINMVCGSGLKAIENVRESIMLDKYKIAIAGGIESMSNVPFLNKSLRNGNKFGQVQLVDALLEDGLTDAFSGEAMGVTAENVARKYNITRLEQDEYAQLSQKRALQATEKGYFDDEIVPISLDNGEQISRDENIRANSSLEKLAKLTPVFEPQGTVTAGNSSPLSDGASALVLMSKATADKMGIPYLAEIDATVEVGVNPKLMGEAPIYAIGKLLEMTNDNISDIDLFEINEAFAAQTVAVIKELQLPIAKVNTNGGAISLGHPLGNSGSRIVVTLIHNLIRQNLHTGIASLCIGGGMGIAMKLTVK